MVTTLKNLVVSVLMVTMMAPFIYLGVTPAKEAQAQAGIIVGGVVGAMACQFQGHIQGFFGDLFGGNGFSMGSFGGDSVPVNETNERLLDNVSKTAETNTQIVFKECVLDAIIWVIKRLLIDRLTQDIINWINSGFDGGPAFLADYHAFFRDIALETFNVFLNQSGLDRWLCSPFQYNIRLTIETLGRKTNYGPTGQYACTLNDILSGAGVSVDVGYSRMVKQGSLDFIGGGIPAAMGLAIDSNNPYGSFFNVQAEAANRMARGANREATLLSFGDGMFSSQCDINGDGRMEVCTPGQLITTQIDDYLGGGLGQLEVADEVAEVLTEVIAELVTSIFNDANQGLLGGSKRTQADYEANRQVSSGSASAPTPNVPPQQPTPPIQPTPPAQPTPPSPPPPPIVVPDGTFFWVPNDPNNPSGGGQYIFQPD